MSKLYEGNAKVTEVYTEELREYQTKGLTPDEMAASFNLIVKVQPDDASFGELKIETEISPRDCTGKLAGQKQTDIGLQTLARHKLVREAKLECLGEVFEAIGKVVSVYQKETTKGEGENAKTYVNTYFSNGAAKLSNAEMQKRLAALTGKPAPKPTPKDDDPFAS